MAAPTGFTTSVSPYNNTDLSSIFAPNFPCNTDYGTINFIGTGTYSTSAFIAMNNNSTNSFNKLTNNNIVNTGIDSGNSYFEFTRNGIYKLNFSYKLNNIAGSGITSGQTFNYYIRFTTDSSALFTNDADLTYYYIESNGNSSNSTTTFDTPQSLSTNNPILIYNSSSNTGYPVFESKYYTTTTSSTNSTPAINFYTISITFIVNTTPYRIYPQYVCTTNTAWTWSWAGNWSATKLYDSSSLPPFSDTNYKILNGNDLNTIDLNTIDLNTIFASIYPQNIQYGTVNFGTTSTTNGAYMNMNNINTSVNSFISRGGNSSIVSTSIASGASFFNFLTPGIYNLTMSYSLDSISVTDVSGTVPAYTTTMYMRLNDNDSTTTDISIPFNFENTFSLANNGNSYNTSGTFSSLDINNLIRMYRQTNTSGYSEGYPVLRSMYINASTSLEAYPRKNIYTLSITFNVPSTLTIYPQYYIDKTISTLTWIWSGNWMVTRISGL